MKGIYFLIPTLVTIFISFLIVRAGGIALMMTGLDKKRAIFQALSAFTGTGFTTREAERVVNHPIRRKAISILMILGNAGIVTVIITATSSIISTEGYRIPMSLLILFAGILIIYKIATSKGFIRSWDRLVEDKLVKRRLFEEEAVEDLLHLIEGYGLVRAIIADDSPLIGNSISYCRSCGEKIIVLGIERGNKWIPIPGDYETMEKGDRVVVYGHHDELKNLFKEEEE